MNCGVVWATDVNPALGKLQNRPILAHFPEPSASSDLRIFLPSFAQGILVNHMSVGFRRAFRERTVAARRREGGDAAMSHFRFVQEWLESCNSRSPDRIMAHYADEAVFQSPSVLALRGLVTDRLLLLLQPLHPLKGTRTTASLTSRSIA